MDAQTAESRQPELDGIRGCAIGLVLLWHYVACQLLAMRTGWSSHIVQALGLSWSGVDLFFVLSGFLIGRILLRQRDSSSYFRTFYLRRACRILPLYALLLGSYALAVALAMPTQERFGWLFDNPLPWWSLLTMCQNVFIGFHPNAANWLNVTWSLAVEEQFYMVVPLLVWLLPRRALAALTLAVIAGAVALRMAFPSAHAYVQTPFRADALFTGLLLAQLFAAEKSRAWLIAHGRWMIALVVALLVAVTLLGPLRTGGRGALGGLALALLYGSFTALPQIRPDTVLSRVLRFVPLRWLGVISFGVYLVHQPVSGMLHGVFRNQAPAIRSLDDVLVTCMALMITICLSIALHFLIERPMMSLGHKVRYAPPKPAIPSCTLEPNTIS